MTRHSQRKTQENEAMASSQHARQTTTRLTVTRWAMLVGMGPSPWTAQDGVAFGWQVSKLAAKTPW